MGRARLLARASGAGPRICRWLEERLAGEAGWNRYHALDGVLRVIGPPDEPGVVRILGGAWVISRGQPDRLEAIDVVLHHDGAARERLGARLGIGARFEQRAIERGKLRLPDDDSGWTYVYQHTFAR